MIRRIGVGGRPTSRPASRARSRAARPPHRRADPRRAARSAIAAPSSAGGARRPPHRSPTRRPPPFPPPPIRPPAPAARRRPRRSALAERSGRRRRSIGQRPGRGSPGRAYTIAEPLPATITAARGARSQSTGCDSVGTPCARNQSARSRWVCTVAAPWSLTTRISVDVQLASRSQPLAHRAHRRVHLAAVPGAPARPPDRSGGCIRPPPGTGRRRSARSASTARSRWRGDRVVRRLMPLGVVRDRAPELALPAGGIALRREPPGDGSEDPDALGHQLEDGADVGRDVVGRAGAPDTRNSCAPPPARATSVPRTPGGRASGSRGCCKCRACSR